MTNEDIHHEDGAPELEFEATVDTIYGEDGVVLESVVETIKDAVFERDIAAVQEVVRDLHESEVGDILAALDNDDRDMLVELAGDDFNFAALTEVDEAIRLGIVENLSNDKVASAVRDLDSDDAVYILEDLESEERQYRAQKRRP